MPGHHSWKSLIRRLSLQRRRRIERGAQRDVEKIVPAELNRRSKAPKKPAAAASASGKRRIPPQGPLGS